eukprot:GFUD01121573.1.p1 GENE.GFUD01121573.1~~GFUD01121573.1.p1  ORF type:complete len:221 (-),score=49.58 GFUD01121573.1:198-821(-)
MRVFLLFIALSISLVAGKPKSPFLSDDDQKAAMIKELEDVQLLKELEMLLRNLDDDQLDKLEAIMGKDIDEDSEFDMIMSELKEMGMEDEDIADLKKLSHLMDEFLSQVPELATKLEFTSEYDLLDNIQLYLLGLPNKLGPLGYIALHHVLEDDEDGDGQIVDVVVEPIIPTMEKEIEVQDKVPTYRRKRSSPLTQVLRARREAQEG